MPNLERAARPFALFVERYYPDPFVFVILLTAVAAVLAIALTDAGPLDTVVAWGEGMPTLMAFIGQVAILLVAAHALAHTDGVGRALAKAARLPQTEWQAYVLVAVVTAAAAGFVWSFGFVGGAILARQVAIEGGNKGLHVHYPLLVATAYAGSSVWHMGYSGSAPLFVATEGHAMQDMMGVLPVTETIFTVWNISLFVVAIVVIALVCTLMRPKNDHAIVFQPEVATAEPTQSQLQGTVGERLDNARLLNLLLGLALLIYLVHWFVTRGFVLDLNIVIWTLLTLLFLLARSPIHVVSLIRNASHSAGLVLLQYPFYAGIMGIMIGTGLVNVVSDSFVAIASQESLPFWAFLSAGVVNLFIPSGGGQWVVQGPPFLAAAETLGVNPAHIVMAVAYGDQWTNLIQPFWTIPLLAIAGLSVKDIMGYCFVVLFALFGVYALALWLLI